MRRILCSLGAAALLAGTASAAPITKQAFTKSYKLTLDVGPVETMYTQADVKMKHPSSGEVIVGSSGSMGMSMGHANHHLEVHVLSRATGKVVTGAKPSITLTDESAMGSMKAAEKVDAMAMEGIGQGVSDLHYGDNVQLTPGHTYRVVVVVDGEKASFAFRA